jgi:hypothetical protein
VRFAFRSLLACVLSASLISLPAVGAGTPNRPLGFVLAAQDAQLDGNAAANGANIYDGDTVATGSGGQVRLQFAGNQVYFSPSSLAKLTTDGSLVTAVLTSGTAGFMSARGGAVAIRALDVLVRPQTAQPTTAQVTIIAPDELKIASIAGPLSLELDGEVYTISPGRTYGVKVVPDSLPPLQNDQFAARKRRGLIIFIFSVTAGVAALIYLHKELTESPDAP